MEFFIWILQGLLAAIFFLAGIVKLMQPQEKLAKKMDWVNDFSKNTLKVVAIAELLGAFGLILPNLTGLPQSIVSLSALGLAIVQFLAMGVHFKRNEKNLMMVNTVLLLISVFVAYYRFSSNAW